MALDRSRKPDTEGLRVSWLELLHYAAQQLNAAGLSLVDPEEIINEAVGALCDQKCPESCPQNAFLKKQIKQRVFNRVRARKSEQKCLADVKAGSESSSKPTVEDKMIIQNVFDRTMEELLEIAEAQPKNEDLVTLVIAYSEQHEKREDRMEAAGLTEDQYKAAHKRLRTLIPKLSETLRIDVHECLAEADNE